MKTNPHHVLIGAVVLAAGMSRRMGQPKMALPWGNTTVLGQVLSVLKQAALSEIVVVTGGNRETVEKLLIAHRVKTVFNEKYQNDHMLLSLQAGIRNLSKNISAAMVVLGDQPHLQLDVVRLLVDEYTESKPVLLAPSFQNRRGHPWILDRKLWDDLLSQRPPLTLRQWLQSHSREIKYLEVGTETIFRDLDTPEDYQRERPGKEGL